LYTLKVKYKDEDAPRIQLPREEDIGIDVYANETVKVFLHESALVGTGLHVQPPSGYWLQILDRSSVSKYLHVMAGVVDEGYVGEVKVRVFCHTVDKDSTGWSHEIKKGEKIAQLIIRKNFNRDFTLEEVEELESTERGEDGFGSTGG
jgi:dUTP pyrophosphatase